MQDLRRFGVSAVLAVVLVACGGLGGGGGGDTRALDPLPGLDPYLDRLLAQCEADDVESCARLMLEDGDAEYRERALAALQGGGRPTGDSGGVGDTEERLEACEAGDVDVCTELYLEAPVGSELEERALDGILDGFLAEPPSGGSGAIDPDGEAFFGDVVLDSGFTPDPYVVELTAGGGSDASELSSGCVGYVGSRPDVRLVFEAGVLPLNIYAIGAGDDLTLVVRDPSGRYRCNDDYEGLEPAVLIDRPQSGTYDIWVGVWTGPGEFADAALLITELDPVFP